MNDVKVSAPGKLHLLGEHSVVYGKPALITAIDKRCVVTVTRQKEQCITLIAPAFTLKERVPFTRVKEKILESDRLLDIFRQTNNSDLLKSICAHPRDYLLISIAESFRFFNQPFSHGFILNVESAIPVGSGLGSSAAVAVCIAAGISLFLGNPLNVQYCDQIAYKIEQKKHGFSSGGDSAAICFGGCILYQKLPGGEKSIQQIPFSLPEALRRNFSLIQTGIPVESTGFMVSYVRRLYSLDPKPVQKIFNEQGLLVPALIRAFEKQDITVLKTILKKGEDNLEKLGVVSSSTKQLIRTIETQGGSAKICGAGGISGASGIVLAFHDDLAIIKDISRQFSFPSEHVTVSAQGVREEKYE